jgi:signal transduction histidine kinase
MNHTPNQMKSQNTLSLGDLFIQYSKYFFIASLIIAIGVLNGWIFDLNVLNRITPGLVAMNPLTALCFILLTIAFFLLKTSKPKEVYIAHTLVILVVLFALIKITGLVIGANDYIDTILFHSKLQNARVGDIENRMAPNAAICFVLSGVSLLLAHYKNHTEQQISEYLSIIVILISLLSIIGYLYGVSFYYQMLAYMPMAIHAAFCFLLQALAILFAFPHRGLMKDITNQHAGGRMARKILPAIFLVATLLGLTSLLGKRALLYDAEFGMATFTITVITLLTIITLKSARSLNSVDRHRDTTEKALASANEELTIQAEQLVQLNNELESFCYSVSHDLRAPLRSIGGYSQILEEDCYDKLDDAGKRSLHTIIKSTNKMNQLIDGLLNFSKLGRNPIIRTSINMHALAENVAKELTRSRNETIEIEIDALPNAQGDYAMISLVFQNLISNAYKYSSKKENPKIKIGSLHKNNEVVYFVKDNGVGFDMNYYHKLFGVFQRLHRDKEFEGNGIGLATVNRIIQRHGGKVWAESNVDEGTIFYFTLQESN